MGSCCGCCAGVDDYQGNSGEGECSCCGNCKCKCICKGRKRCSKGNGKDQKSYLPLAIENETDRRNIGAEVRESSDDKPMRTNNVRQRKENLSTSPLLGLPTGHTITPAGPGPSPAPSHPPNEQPQAPSMPEPPRAPAPKPEPVPAPVPAPEPEPLQTPEPEPEPVPEPVPRITEAQRKQLEDLIREVEDLKRQREKLQDEADALAKSLSELTPRVVLRGVVIDDSDLTWQDGINELNAAIEDVQAQLAEIEAEMKLARVEG